jgi:hypothetical protein
VGVPPGSLTPTIISLSLVTWIPRGNKGDTERNGFISLDFVISCDNDIIVGVIESCGTPTPTDKSTRALLIFGIDGKEQHTYQYDSNKHRLFTGPFRITTNKTWRACVL